MIFGIYFERNNRRNVTHHHQRLLWMENSVKRTMSVKESFEDINSRDPDHLTGSRLRITLKIHLVQFGPVF